MKIKISHRIYDEHPVGRSMIAQGGRMKLKNILNVIYTVSFLFLVARPVLSQDSVQTTKQEKAPRKWLMHQLSDQDVFLPISSIEWGTPDRWSITSRYIHMFEKDRDNRTWLNNISITLSPGIAGGRFAIGYQGILTPASMPDFGLFSEARIVLLRTWGNPLSTIANLTFVGVETRSSLSGMINFGIGYFTQISGPDNDRQQFYGFQIGIGI